MKTWIPVFFGKKDEDGDLLCGGAAEFSNADLAMEYADFKKSQGFLILKTKTFRPEDDKINMSFIDEVQH